MGVRGEEEKWRIMREKKNWGRGGGGTFGQRKG